MEHLTQNEFLYLQWLKNAHPQIYDAVSAQGEGLSGILDTIGSTLEKVVNAAAKGATTYVQTKEQLALLKQNTQRAKLGLPPLTAGGVIYAGDGSYPMMATPWYQNPLVWIAGGGLLLLLVMRK